MKEIYHCSFFQFFGLILKHFYYESQAGVGLKSRFPVRSVSQKRNQGHVPVTAGKRAVKILKFVTVTVGPLFSKFGNRNNTK